MENSFLKVKNYLIDLNCNIVHENSEDGIFVINNEENGISNLVIGCADPLLIIEQFLFELKEDSLPIFKSLLIKNRDIVHGALVLDGDGTRVIFRDTLQIENLDLNELEGTLNSLVLFLSEYADEIIRFSKIS